MSSKTTLTENFKASFGVPAEIPGPVTPQGGTDKKRPADKTEGDTAMPRLSKTGMVQALVSAATALSKTDLEGKYGDVLATLQGKGTDNSSKNRASISVKEDLDAMFAADETLSEEFRTTAATLFEAAVSARVQIERSQIEEEMEQRLDEAVTSLAEQVDQYLDYVVSEWLDENRLAVETGVRNEVTESFLAGLHGLFEHHYISVPEDKVDVVEELVAQVDELSQSLEEMARENAAIQEQLQSDIKRKVIADIAEGLTATQADRFLLLAEDIGFASEDEYREKLTTIREHYFTVTPPANRGAALLSEEVDVPGGDQPKALDPLMSRYVSSLSRNAKSKT